MLSWILQITIISVIFIILVHHLIHFLTSALTIPKVKDLVHIPNQKYETMYNIINKTNGETPLSQPLSQPLSNPSELPNADYTLIDLLPTHQNEPSSMKNELKNFLKKQMKGSSHIQVESIDSSSAPSYASF
jgi:hypothetical protein